MWYAGELDVESALFVLLTVGVFVGALAVAGFIGEWYERRRRNHEQ